MRGPDKRFGVGRIAAGYKVEIIDEDGGRMRGETKASRNWE